MLYHLPHILISNYFEEFSPSYIDYYYFSIFTYLAMIFFCNLHRNMYQVTKNCSFADDTLTFFFYIPDFNCDTLIFFFPFCTSSCGLMFTLLLPSDYQVYQSSELMFYMVLNGREKLTYQSWLSICQCFIILISYLLKWSRESWIEIEKYIIKWVVTIAGG